MVHRTTLLAATMLAGTAFASAALAQPVDGVYIGAGAGLNFRQNDSIRNVGNIAGATAPVSVNGRVHTVNDLGFAGVLSLGYGLGNGLRFEGEGDFRQNDVRHIEGTAFPTNAKGQTRTYGVMGNAFYDFNFSQFGLDELDTYLPQPYIGAGVGYQWTDFDSVRATNADLPFSVRSNGTNGNFAYQGIAGVAFPIAEVPGLSLTTEYRFLGLTANTRFRTSVNTGEGISTGKVSVGDQFNHSILFGVRYAFDQAEPPSPVSTPPVVQSPTTPRSYLVFFDWDRADLTARARQIIGQAAQASRSTQTTRLEVNGYTDTSGTAAYNQRLSIRRAQSVAAELVRDGVARNEISIQGFGETNLLVPTAQGVREPQNRRVEIILH